MVEFVLAYVCGIINMTIGTLAIFGCVALVADYINTKLKLKQLQQELLQCRHILYGDRSESST